MALTWLSRPVGMTKFNGRLAMPGALLANTVSSAFPNATLLSTPGNF
jgi:hypothetical protein